MKQNELLYMTRAAYLNAIALAFLGLQFVIPVAYLLLLPIVPAIFALQVCLVSARRALLSGCILLVLAFLVLGIDVGLWTVVYVATGSALGLVWRSRAAWFVRAAATTATAGLSLLGVILALSRLTQISLAQAAGVAQNLPVFQGLPLASLFGVAVILIGLLIWLASDRLVFAVITQLQDSSA